MSKMPHYTSTTNACKLCKPLGASLAFRGIEGTVPFLHGSQGCATYMRRYIISHFNEPIDIASSSLGEKHAVYGGSANLKLGLQNVTKKYAPQLIGVATTCLTETIGDDVRMIVSEYEAGVPPGERPSQDRLGLDPELCRDPYGGLSCRPAGGGRAADRTGRTACGDQFPARFRFGGRSPLSQGSAGRFRHRPHPVPGLLRVPRRPGPERLSADPGRRHPPGRDQKDGRGQDDHRVRGHPAQGIGRHQPEAAVRHAPAPHRPCRSASGRPTG